MFGDNDRAAPTAWRAIQARTAALGFDMPSEADTGALLRLLAASKPGGRFLELGTGTGLATAWLLSGMDVSARLTSVDVDPIVQGVAREHLWDERVRFVLGDGLDYVRSQQASSFDMIFADAWPGKYEGLDETLALLKQGGLYVIDDMSPQPNWPEGHQANVDGLVARLEVRADLIVTRVAWASGLVLAAVR
ncbi:methyltransferase domain-containing protein [Caulobacter segnis]|uniref:Methyltransferase type 11 n=2 Tax=Caulobacter segnis TaxID=88688 RepID=D5VFV1_CAUST|nr:class I SAM-dependent methyltransferase [Caulobacter segnis]ADG09954.1 Methyltransferase type 11 [Caulobacter segnis ATCC 21756]AVQ01708.1 methyltransferase domain-containing protein [Caulobacter segnis]